MARSQRFVHLKRHRDYKDFSIDQVSPRHKEAGIGPYMLLYKDHEVLRRARFGECHDQLEKLVSEKWQLDERIRKMKQKFCQDWGLKDFPESA